MRNFTTNSRLHKAALRMAFLSASIFAAIGLFAPSITGSSAYAAGMGMPMKHDMPGSSMAGTTAGYRFEQVGAPRSSGGKSIVSVQILRAADKKPVTGAIIIRSRADMSPMGMAKMTAPIKPIPSSMPGIYTFEIANGPIWKKTDKWALSFSAKVQGETQTVHGAVVVTLSP